MRRREAKRLPVLGRGFIPPPRFLQDSGEPEVGVRVVRDQPDRLPERIDGEVVALLRAEGEADVRVQLRRVPPDREGGAVVFERLVDSAERDQRQAEIIPDEHVVRKILPISTEAFAAAATRPRVSVLSKRKMHDAFGE